MTHAEEMFTRDRAMPSHLRRLIIAVATLALSHVAAVARPNVLLIYADDLNDWAIGGHAQAVTPNLDRLRAQSVDFTDAHTPGSACRPARTSVLTGRTPWALGVTGNSSPPLRQSLLPTAPTLNQMLRDRGYRVESLGKVDHRGELADEWDSHEHNAGNRQETLARRAVGIPRPARLRGFDQDDLDWGPLPGVAEAAYSDRGMTDQAIARLGTLPVTKPWLLAVGLRRTHLPYYCPQRHHDMIAPESLIVVPETPAGDLDDVGPRLREWIDGDSEYRAVLDAGLE